MTNEVLDSALYVVTHAQDVTIKEEGIRSSAAFIHMSMMEKAYSQETWSSHALHPKTKSKETLYFIFFLDLMNFNFWSDSEKFTVRYGGQSWTGYWSLCALIRRAKEKKFPLLDPPMVGSGQRRGSAPLLPWRNDMPNSTLGRAYPDFARIFCASRQSLGRLGGAAY